MGRLDAAVLVLLLIGSGIISGFTFEIPYIGNLLTKAASIVMGGMA